MALMRLWSEIGTGLLSGRQSGRRVAFGLAVAVVLAALTTYGLRHSAPPRLRTIAQVQRLALAEESSVTSPVIFRGIVTYSAGHILFVQDQTGGIKVDTTEILNQPPISALVEAHGVVLQTSGPPVLVHGSLSVLGHAELPIAVPVRAADLSDAKFAGRMVELRGVGQSAAIDRDGFLRLRVRDGDEVVSARISANSTVNRDALVGASVSIKGVADAVMSVGGSVDEERMWAGSSDALNVEKAATARFSVPVSLVSQVTSHSASALLLANGRVRMRGQVTDDGRGGLVFRDATGSLPLRMAETLLSSSGSDLWVWAFPRVSSAGTFLDDAEVEDVNQSIALKREKRSMHFQRTADVRSMDPREADKRYPVRLEATVTYASESEGLLFVQDESGGIYVDVTGPLPKGITAGWRVVVEGRTSSGGFAPDVYSAQEVRHIGQAALPTPVVVSTEGLLSPRQDSQWIQVEGVARSVERVNSYVILRLINGPVRFTAYLNGYPDVPKYLLGSRVRLTGACGSSFNSRGQFNGLEVYIQRPEQVEIIRPPMSFADTPIRSVTSLLEFSPSDEPGVAKRVSGVVTMITRSHSVFIRDSSGGLEIIPASPTTLRLGDVVEATGYVRPTRLGGVLEDADIRKLHSGPMPEAKHTSAYQILNNNIDSSLVELDAKLISQVPTLGDVRLLLNSAGTYFTATLESSSPLRTTLEPGSVVRLRGICVLQPPPSVIENIPDGFDLRLRTPEDISVLKPASWWTVEHAYQVVLAAGILLTVCFLLVLILHRKVKQQTATIHKKLLIEAALREQAQSASLAKTQFLANMSHEIRTPINGMIGYARLALASTAETETREYLGIITESASALVRVINDILDLSKIEAGRFSLEKLAFPLRQELQAAIRIFRPEAMRKGLDLTLDVDEDVPGYVIGDPLRLRQILLNLVGNAMKFTSQGFVRAKVSVDGCANENMTLRFCISDSGIGIPPDKQHAVFGAFTQADSSISRQHGGTGLGLTITAKLVALAGGQMHLQSEPGSGTEFNFTLVFGKVAADFMDSAPTESETAPEPVIPSGMSFLVAEDNVINQRLIQTLLQRSGQNVEIAANGRLAIEAFSRPGASYDVMLMDVQMPECDGYQATREIRQIEKLRQLSRMPIVGLTAHAMEGERDRCLGAGMDGYATKPIDMKALFREINACLQGVEAKEPDLVL